MLEYMRERAGLELRFIAEYWYLYVAMIIILFIAFYVTYRNK